MTAELRAALRAAASAWESLGTRAAHPECDSHPLVNPDHCAGHAAALRALADAPPTVAELLPLVDATHEVRWVAATGEEMRYRHGNGCEYLRSRDHRWGQASLNRHDITQPATLVEVSP